MKNRVEQATVDPEKALPVASVVLEKQSSRPAFITWIEHLRQSRLFALLSSFPSRVFYLTAFFYLLLTSLHLWLQGAPSTQGPALSGLAGWGAQATAAWRRFDTFFFLEIVHRSYTNQGVGAFFPLYPALVRVVAWPLGNHFTLAALVVSWACAWGSYCWFYRLAEREYGERVARLALLFLALCPISFFSFAAYSESLFLLVSIGAVERARAGRPWQAGALGALGMLCRPTGILLLIPLAWELARRAEWRQPAGWRRMSRLRASGPQVPLQELPQPRLAERPLGWEESAQADVAAERPQARFQPPALAGTLTVLSNYSNRQMILSGLSLMLIPLALLGYMAFLQHATGNALAFLHGENIWGRHLTLPWDTAGLFALTFQHAWQTSDYTVAIGNLVDLLLTVPLPLLVLYLSIRRRVLWFGAALYQLALTLMLVAIPIHPGPDGPWEIFFSTQRFMLPAFPLFLLMGRFGMAHPRLYRVLLIASSILLALNTLRFLDGIFIA